MSRPTLTQHDETLWCNLKTANCAYLVKEHQNPEPEVTVPEFTISVRYQPEIVDMPARMLGHPSLRQGWKWSISWTGKDGGRKMRTGYGFPTSGGAKIAAEAKAAAIALASLPEEVYTYTPEF